jgi:L-cysteine/cystine lyase
LYAGAEESANFLDDIGMSKIEVRVKELATRLQQGLLQLGNRIEMLTSHEAQSRGAMITFKIPRMASTDFNAIASKNSFRIRVVPESGLNAIRISTHVYNNEPDVDRFVKLVKVNG